MDEMEYTAVNLICGYFSVVGSCAIHCARMLFSSGPHFSTLRGMSFAQLIARGKIAPTMTLSANN